MAAPSTQYDHPAGINEASWMTEYFFDVTRRTSKLPRKFAVFAGIEHLVQTMPLGGCGAFSLLTVVFPDLIREQDELCEHGDYAAAKPLQYQASQLLLTIKQFKMHSATKAMVEMQGRPMGLPRQPNLPLTPGEREALVARLTEIGVWPTHSLAQAA